MIGLSWLLQIFENPFWIFQTVMKIFQIENGEISWYGLHGCYKYLIFSPYSSTNKYIFEIYKKNPW